MKQTKLSQTLPIAGIPVEVHKKTIRHVYLRVRTVDGRVTVSAPRSMSDAAIERFVRAKLGWIQKQRQKTAARLEQAEADGENADTLSVWGKQYPLQTAVGSKYGVSLTGEQAVLTVRKGSTPEQRARFLREWYRGLLKAEVPRLLRKWEAATGLQASGWQTKYMTTRWGSCNTKTGKIWLNVQLAKRAPICLEYVILHELMHLKERGHNARFYALMDTYMPDWRAVKAALNGRRGSAGE